MQSVIAQTVKPTSAKRSCLSWCSSWSVVVTCP